MRYEFRLVSERGPEILIGWALLTYDRTREWWSLRAEMGERIHNDPTLIINHGETPKDAATRFLDTGCGMTVTGPWRELNQRWSDGHHFVTYAAPLTGTASPDMTLLADEGHPTRDEEFAAKVARLGRTPGAAR